MTTIADVAKLAGVSPTQVSFVVNQNNLERVSSERRRRIERAIAELNFTPNMAARQLAGKRSRLLGVVMHTHVAHVNYGRLSAIDEEAARLGYQVMVGGSIASPKGTGAKARELAAYNLDGLICIAHDYPEDPGAVPEQLRDYPNVVYLEKPAIDGAWYVREDFEEASRGCVRHLVNAGRKRIGLCLSDQVYRVNRDRLAGYEKSLGEAGVAVDEALIGIPDDPACGQMLGMVSAEALLDRLVSDGKADAILAFNDYWAARLIKCLIGRGLRVPEDVAVIGFNNLAFGELLVPGLTTVDERDQEVARHLVRMLADKIEGRDVPAAQRQVTVKPQLIVRGSG